VRLRRRRPPAARPAPLPPEEAARLGRVPETGDFLTGNGFAARCGHVVNYEDLVLNEDADNDWWFCKVDHLEWFFAELEPPGPYVLVSHNGDYPIGEAFRRQLRSRRLAGWLAANAAFSHPKLIPIPLGIANPGWEHGDPRALRAAQAESTSKTELFDVSFSLATNERERRYCLEQTGLQLAPRVPHPEYLARLGSAYFCVSPSGYGIDTHRTWEALYLRTVPVVRRSALTDEYADLPIVALDDWADFGSIEFGPELHRRLTAGWDPGALSMDAFIARLRRRLGSRA
jgi:hypothetical protein